MVHFGLRAALSYFKWKRELLSHFILSKLVSAENCHQFLTHLYELQQLKATNWSLIHSVNLKRRPTSFWAMEASLKLNRAAELLF